MAKTQEKDRERKAAPVATKEATAVATIAQARLPYHPAVKDKFGVDAGQWRVLVDSIWPAAKTAEAVILALSYCKARNLDPFKKPVHIVPVWSSSLNRMIETCWPGISELRTTATRTGSYAGCDVCDFGPTVTKTFKGERDGKKREVEVAFPEYARMTVYKIVHGHRVPFVGPEVVWLEAYATTGRNSELPNEMWETRARGQLEKCAEAAALRRAFPEELGGELTAEEMEGKTIDGTVGGAQLVNAPARPKPEDFVNGNAPKPDEPKKNGGDKKNPAKEGAKAAAKEPAAPAEDEKRPLYVGWKPKPDDEIAAFVHTKMRESAVEDMTVKAFEKIDDMVCAQISGNHRDEDLRPIWNDFYKDRKDELAKEALADT